MVRLTLQRVISLARFCSLHCCQDDGGGPHRSATKFNLGAFCSRASGKRNSRIGGNSLIKLLN